MFKQEEISQEELRQMQELTWERILIRSGFYADKLPNGFDLSKENKTNRNFLSRILKKLNIAETFDGSIFIPKTETIHESVWFKAIACLHSGAEGGPSGFENIELHIMDTFIGGVVRWVNAIGIKTSYSCDGHGERPPKIEVYDKVKPDVLDACLAAISNGRWRCCRNGCLIRKDKPRRTQVQDLYDRYWLLDVAETIYHNRHFLQGVVKRCQI